MPTKPPKRDVKSSGQSDAEVASEDTSSKQRRATPVQPDQKAFLTKEKAKLSKLLGAAITWDQLAVLAGIKPRALKTYRMPELSTNFRAMGHPELYSIQSICYRPKHDIVQALKKLGMPLEQVDADVPPATRARSGLASAHDDQVRPSQVQVDESSPSQVILSVFNANGTRGQAVFALTTEACEKHPKTTKAIQALAKAMRQDQSSSVLARDPKDQAGQTTKK
jgi:hypothetical protein